MMPNKLSFVPVTTKSSPCVKTEVFHFLLWNNFLELRAPAHNPNFRDDLVNLVPNSLLHLWYRICFLQQSDFPEQSSADDFTRAGLRALAWKYAREIFTCISENFGL